MGKDNRIILPRFDFDPSRLAIALTLLFLLPSLIPFTNVDAEARIESDDFEILDDLSNLLSERQNIINTNSIGSLAEPKIENINNLVSPSGDSDPLSNIGQGVNNISLIDTNPPVPSHPDAYDLAISGASRPGEVNNIWQTLINVTDYVIWTKYTDINGNVIEQFETVTFSASLLSLFNFNTDPLLHSIDIDDDGDDDIQVGLSVSWEFNGGWGIEGDTLWIEPGISFTVKVLEDSVDDSDWNSLRFLQVSLIKAFAYSADDAVLALGDGESYIWIVDSRFTSAPYDFSIEIGIERFYFDISQASSGLLLALTLGLIDIGQDETGISFASISAPYSIRVNNAGQISCPSRYSPSELTTLPSEEINCGVSVGLGYIHFSPPNNDGTRNVWELAYIDATFHPNGESDRLPSEAEIIIRTDSILPTSTGLEGDKSLTTIEYWADDRADLFLHFHENRSNLPSSESDGNYGNVTDSLGWFRGMPEGSMSPNEISRIFRMLGSENSPELPGGQPDRLGLIIGVKNFSRDTSPNVNDLTLPINPANPPNSLILLRSKQSIESLDYYSWFKRGGIQEDHRAIHVKATDIPTALIVYGSFEMGGSSDVDTSLDSASDLDFISKIVDSVILNLVDLFLDTGSVLNDVPTIIVDLLSGDATSGSFDGASFHMLMTNNWREDRSMMPLNSIELAIGSSSHPTIDGDHLILSKDTDLTIIQGRNGPVEPLASIAASLSFSGFMAASFVDNNETNEQKIDIFTDSNKKLVMSFIEHPSESIVNFSHHAILFSDLPNELSIIISEDSLDYSASSIIDTISYTGNEGNQYQAANIIDLPANFVQTFGNTVSWSSDTPITTIEAQISNSSTPITMSGDHFLFHNNPINNQVSLSSRISGLKEVGWIEPQEEGAEGLAGMGTAYLNIANPNPMLFSVEKAPTNFDDKLSVKAEINPLPSSVSLRIPTGANEGPGLIIPEFNTSNGLSGIASFISGFSDLGRSMNDVLSGITTDISTGSGSDSSNFSFGIELDSDSEFDIVVESYHGDKRSENLPWVHGVSLEASPTGISDGFHLRLWIPRLPPSIELSISRDGSENQQDWSIYVDLESWYPQHTELMLVIRGINGQDLFVTMKGLKVGEYTSLGLDSIITITTFGEITEVSTTSLYELSNRLEWIHVLLINREAGLRTEIMIKDIPESVELQASLGSAISIDMTVPEQFRTSEGFAVGSMMIQQMQWMDDLWWPATIFLTDIPGSMNLTTEPDLNFDITKDLAFQGSPILDFTASDVGMSMYIEAFGRAINSRGDIVLLAEGMTNKMIIKPTDSFGLQIRSGGDGVEKIYLRSSNIPTTPPIVIDEMEALGENLKSATIHIREIVYPYSVIEIDDVQGGRIIASARLHAEVDDRNIDLKGVLIDAQITGGIPTGTTFGINGLASDLSILSVIPGVSGSTSHIMAPEPLSSGILTVLTFLGGGNNGPT
tara:strand:- start:43608 stop:47987 length:4380 start_codon:yes stop_codon:yes gene_type:complete